MLSFQDGEEEQDERFCSQQAGRKYQIAVV
jgi:hypothetical protein